jgi:hypothetical protein
LKVRAFASLDVCKLGTIFKLGHWPGRTVVSWDLRKLGHWQVACQQEMPKDAYSDSMWHHRGNASRRALCEGSDVSRPSTATTLECAACHQEKPKDAYSDSMWHHRGDASRRSLCNDCEVSQSLCDLCGQMKPKDAYSEGAWHNKSSSSQRSLCKACACPACLSPHCKTCRLC